jgi:hypothetical protein
MENFPLDPANFETLPYGGRVTYAEPRYLHGVVRPLPMQPTPETLEDPEREADPRSAQVGGVVLKIAQSASDGADDIMHRVLHDGMPSQAYTLSNRMYVNSLPEAASGFDRPATELVGHLNVLRLAEVTDLNQRHQNFALQLAEITRRQAA